MSRLSHLPDEDVEQVRTRRIALDSDRMPWLIVEVLAPTPGDVYRAYPPVWYQKEFGLICNCADDLTTLAVSLGRTSL